MGSDAFRRRRAKAPRVAAILAGELGRDAAWQQRQTEAFTALAAKYALHSKGM